MWGVQADWRVVIGWAGPWLQAPTTSMSVLSYRFPNRQNIHLLLLQLITHAFPAQKELGRVTESIMKIMHLFKIPLGYNMLSPGQHSKSSPSNKKSMCAFSAQEELGQAGRTGRLKNRWEIKKFYFN